MPLISLGRSDSTTTGVVGEEGVQGVRVNLKSFREILNDFARPYLFQIDIPAVDDSSQTLTMLAKSTLLPSMNLEDKGFEFQGSKYKMAGHATFDDWNVTFLADEYHRLRHKFLAWQSLIYDPIRQIPFTAGSYKRNDVRVIQLSKDADVVSGYRFFGLYPSRVGEIQLDQGAKEVETFTVTFSYDYFIIDTDVAGYSPAMAKIDGATYKYDENYNTYDGDENGERERSSNLETENDGIYNQKDGKQTDFSDKNGPREHSSNLLKDKAGNADLDWNGRGNTQSAPLGFVADQIKKLNPFGRNGDINTSDPFTFLDAANWMNFRYSPPLSFRIRKYLGKDINDGIDKFKVPEINPYAWTGLEKPK